MLRAAARARSVPGSLAWVAAFCIALLSGPERAHARDRVDKLIDQLESSEDFRVRTQAALALGASKTKRALSPLCKALEDSNTTVRAASAAALGKLRLGGRECLQKRLAGEPNASVKASIKKAIGLVAPAGSAEPAITSSTRYYLAIGKTTDKTGRNGSEVDGIVRAAMLRTAAGIEGYAVAPDGETAPQAKKRLGKFKKLKAFFFLPRVASPKYADSNLTVKLEVAVFTYPDKALRGTYSVNFTQENVSSQDTEAENDLIRIAAERAVEKFDANATRFE